MYAGYREQLWWPEMEYWCWLCGDDATGFLALKDNKRHLDKLNSSFQPELHADS